MPLEIGDKVTAQSWLAATCPAPGEVIRVRPDGQLYVRWANGAERKHIPSDFVTSAEAVALAAQELAALAPALEGAMTFKSKVVTVVALAVLAVVNLVAAAINFYTLFGST